MCGIKLRGARYLFAATMFAGCTAVYAAYPEKPVNLVVPYPPGGTTDALARVLSAELAKSLGQPVIVENRGGAGGSLGTAAVAKAAPDGYTLLLGNIGPMAINPSVYENLSYDPGKDFAPITLVAEFPLFLVVHPDIPAKNVRELKSYAQSQPHPLNFASVGVGSLSHLTGELFSSRTGVPLMHVPYKGGGPAITDLLGGQVQMMFLGIYDGNIQSGRLRALGTSSAKRAAVTPDLPTLAEDGVEGFDVSSWFGILAPRGTPAGIVDQLHAQLAEIIARPEMRERIEKLGGTPVTNRPEVFQGLIESEIERWRSIVGDTPALGADGDGKSRPSL